MSAQWRIRASAGTAGGSTLMRRPFCDLCGVEIDEFPQKPAPRVHFVAIDENRSVRLEFFINRGGEHIDACSNCRIIQTADALRAMLPEHLKETTIFDAAKALQEQIDSTKEKICP